MNNPSTRSAGFSGDGSQVWFMQQVTARPLRWTSWISSALGGDPRIFVEGGLEPIWSPDGKNVVYHTNDLGDPIFISDRNGSHPRQIFVAPPGVHGHYLVARRSLHLFRQGRPPDRRNGYLANSRVLKRRRDGARANHFSQCAGGVPRVARCANADLLGHG